MADPKETPPEQHDDSSSLEGSGTMSDPGTSSSSSADTLENTSTDTVRAEPSTDGTKAVTKPQASFVGGKIKKIRSHLNIYLLMFVLILIIAGGILVATALSDKESKDPSISNQTLSADALKDLANTDATVGDPKQILNVQSNAVFAGKVLIRESLDVAGQINVGGSLSLPGITVSGDSTFDQVQINKALSIGGDTSIQGQLTVKKNVSISGTAAFGGAISAPQISTSSLQLIGDLNLTRHVVAGGATPGRSIGGALGGGGTGSVSGSDNGGTININTGGGPSAGCLITVNFVNRYDNTPHVVISPVGSAAAGLDYYVNRTTASFSVCTLNPPAASASFAFDYFITG